MHSSIEDIDGIVLSGRKMFNDIISSTTIIFEDPFVLVKPFVDAGKSFVDVNCVLERIFTN